MKGFIKYLIIFILIIFVLPIILTNRNKKQVIAPVDVPEENNSIVENLRWFHKNKIIT